MEADGVRAMVYWLKRAPEEFFIGTAVNTSPPPLLCSPSMPGRVRRFDTAALYAALEARRRSEHLSWRQTANALGGHVAPAMLTRLKRRGRIDVDLMVAATCWLGASVESFTYEAAR